MTLSAEKRLKSAAVALALGGLLLAVAGFGYLRLTPKTFQATAKIRVWQTGRFDTNDTHAAFDAGRLARSECQVLRSDAILDHAIQNLGAPWTRPGGRDRLRLITEAGPMPDSDVIQLTATGRDPVQLAALANEIARAYCDYRQTTRQETTHQSLDALQNELAALDPKILQAWTNLARACEDFTPSAGGLVLYDPDSYRILESNRARMELDAGKKESRLTELKSMDVEKLRQTLPVLDGRTNLLLVSSLTQLKHAQEELATARVQYGPESDRIRQAETVLAECQKSVDRAVAGALTAQALELSSLKTALQMMNAKLSRATTNQKEMIAAHPELAAPARELENLERQRDLLKEKMKHEDSVKASLPILPVAISANLVEPAEPPGNPVSPDARIANAAMLAGGIITTAGLFLRSLLPKPKLVPAKSR